MAPSPAGTRIPRDGASLVDGVGGTWTIDSAGWACRNGARTTGHAVAVDWNGTDIFVLSPKGGVWYRVKWGVSWMALSTTDPDPVVVPPPQPPAPPLAPTITNATATPATLAIGGGLVTVDAIVTNATSVTVDGVVKTLPAAVNVIVSRSITIVATGVTAPPASASVPVTVAVSVPTGMPTSADFLPKAQDPRAAQPYASSAGYEAMKRMANGHMITFGMSHTHSENNAVITYDPVADAWTTRIPHTVVTFPSTASEAGLSYLLNRDNQVQLAVRGTFPSGAAINEFIVCQGIGGGSNGTGNYRGVVNTSTWTWQDIDDSGTWTNVTGAVDPPFIWDGLGEWIDGLNVGVIYGGTQGNPGDKLYILIPRTGNPRYTLKAYTPDEGGNPSFSGSEMLRYVSQSSFVRGNYLYIYGGVHRTHQTLVDTLSQTLYKLDLTNPAVPVMTIQSVNILPVDQAVKGDAVLADYDAAHDLAVITNGALVNVYSFATNTWANVPVNTSADPGRMSPEASGTGAQARWSPEVGQMIILSSDNGRTFGLRLNYGAVPAPIPTPTPVPTPPPTPTPPPPVPPLPPAGSLTLTSTAVPFTGVSGVLANSKHLDFARLGNRWYKLAGDHTATGDPLDISIPPQSAPPESQGGRQEVLSFNVTANDWREDTPYHLPLSYGEQGGDPDDAFAFTVKNEAWVINSATNRGLVQPAGAAIQFYLADTIGAYSPPSTQWPLGHWRKVAPVPTVLRGNRAWRGYHDAVTNRVLIPTGNGGLAMTVLDGTTGADLSWYVGGQPVTYGNRFCVTAGMAVDVVGRKIYLYDIQSCDLWSVDMDSGTPTGTPFTVNKVANIPEAPLGTQAAVKICFHPTKRAVFLNLTKSHAYEIDSGKLTTWPRKDGYVDAVNVYVPTSTCFYDPDTGDIISIGMEDFTEGGGYPPAYVYWRLKIN